MLDCSTKEIKDKNLEEKFEFRAVRPEEGKEVSEIEQICFPPNEACTEKMMIERVNKAPELFLVAVDKETGVIAGFLNGISTDEEVFRDEFFFDISLYDPNGAHVMLLGLDVRPEYRGMGLAREIMHQYLAKEKAKGRTSAILTCLDNKVAMYTKFGYRDLGISNSIWGGEQWHDMVFELNAKKEKICLIVPCYNEEEALPYFYKEVVRVSAEMPEVDYEFLFVNDGSKDGTLELLKKFAAEDERVKFCSFSRNFGKEAAMYAGFCNSTDADFVAVMDADMQDPPALLPQMYRLIHEEGYDSVATRRVSREGEPPIRSFFARQFYKIINKISDADIVDGARDFRLMKREMADAIIAMSEYNRFSKGIYGWIGFKTYWLPYENVERVAGETKWNFWKLFKYAIDGVINFSQFPLTAVSWGGVFMTFCAFLMLLVVIIRRVIFGDPVAGWASTVCIVIFIGGIQLLCLGIMGQYIAKTYMEAKDRPKFIISETNVDNPRKF